MYKKIFQICFFFLTFLYFWTSFAQNIEDVFQDISKDYPYYQELQYLYDKWVVLPNVQGKFWPKEFLSRDEFVWISMHTMCKECIVPNTPASLFQQYENANPFFDVPKTNQYFYCIADASAQNFVAWYNPWHVCQDATSREWEKPFCTNNQITLEEALAVLLRNANIVTQEQNRQILSQIQAGTLSENLAKDVWVRTANGEVYTFYGYIQKALEYEIVDYDSAGNEKKYFLLTKNEDDTLQPQRFITKEEFLRMAYIIHKTNSCTLQPVPVVEQNIATQLLVFPQICQENNSNCRTQDVQPWQKTYDYKNDFVTSCPTGIQEILWVFSNLTTHETFSRTGAYLDDVSFSSVWQWKVVTMVRDNCWWQATSETYLSYTDGNTTDLWVQIFADPISGTWPLNVNFEWIVTGCEVNCTYNWNFGDGSTASGKDPTHIFTDPGSYDVTLIVTDANGNTATAKVTIRVESWTSQQDGDPNRDTDGDGIPDIRDLCPLIPGVPENSWCPILSQKCVPNAENTCAAWYECAASGICQPAKVAQNTCIVPLSGSSIFGNVACKSCPCDYEVDFFANIRKCDVLFPAIVSPDGTQMFSRGSAYQIPYNK